VICTVSFFFALFLSSFSVAEPVGDIMQIFFLGSIVIIIIIITIIAGVNIHKLSFVTKLIIN
jgi:hypothetical protein